MPKRRQKYRRRRRQKWHQKLLRKLSLGFRHLLERPKLFILVLACLLLFPILLYLVYAWATYPDISGCPARYTRFTVYHTACTKGDHRRCGKVRRRGVTPEEKDVILHAHNRWRDFVSQGRETRSGGMPMSSNMLEMVWDQELEDVAQKMANICEFEHDCNGCRISNNFTVGQNLQIAVAKCQTDTCEGESGSPLVDTDWDERITGFVTELDFFHYSRVPAANFKPDFPTGHVTQILWAKTWRIGCGYTMHDTNYEDRPRDFLTHYFVCHYGPSGNVPGRDMYKIGPPCSECPQGTCCGSSCNVGRRSYPALCMIVDPEVGPTQPWDYASRTIARCAWEYGNPVCGVQLNGKWERVPAYSGHYMMITLEGGESASLDYTYQFPGRGPSPMACLVIEYRAGPSIASYRDKGTLTLVIKSRGQETPKPQTVASLPEAQGRYRFIMDFIVNLPEFMVSVRYSVAAGAISHILDIRELQYLELPCGDYDGMEGKGNGS